MIFSRRGASSGRHAAADPRRSGRHSADRRNVAMDSAMADSAMADSAALTGRHSGDQRDAADHRDATGPYDIAEAPAGPDRIDLGSLRIPAAEGVEINIQMNADGTATHAVLSYGQSTLQLGALAAPRGEEIWAEVRAEIRRSLIDDGVLVEEIAGEYGPELRAHVRAATGSTDLRLLGVDGPRWMLQAVYQGPAAVDPSVAGLLAECLRGVVVDRGHQAMPVRGPLPLRLPRDVAEQPVAQTHPYRDFTSTPSSHQDPLSGSVNRSLNGLNPGYPDSARPDQHHRSPRPRRPN